jgi:hypothetical protein
MMCFADSSASSVVSSSGVSSSSTSGAGRDDVTVSTGDLDGANDVISGLKSAIDSFSENMPTLNPQLLAFMAILQGAFPGASFFWSIVFMSILFGAILMCVRFGWHFGG